jgi:phage gp36-like protein
MARAGQVIEIHRTLRSLTGGGISDADALPTGVMIYRGEEVAGVVTVTDLGVGEYKIAWTVPTTVRVGYMFAIRLDIIMGGIPDEYVIWEQMITHSALSSSAAVPGAYCSRDDMEKRYGSRAIEKWADLDGEEAPAHIDERIEWAIEQTYADFNATLANGPYTLPIETADPVLVDMAARYASGLLFESRVRDQDEEDQKKRMGPSTDKIRSKLNRHLVGAARFPTVGYPIATYPQVFDDELELLPDDYDDSDRWWGA